MFSVKPVVPPEGVERDADERQAVNQEQLHQKRRAAEDQT
jgi:hypothetical protein